MAIQPVKTAVVGCGMISDAYLSTMINKFNILDVVGCSNRNMEKAYAKAKQYGIKAMTMEEILADSSIEIAVNLTPVPAHYGLIRQLLAGGKNVYTEKVLTVNMNEACELMALAKDKNLYLGAAPDTFLGSAIQTARYIVESGMIGDISSFSCSLSRDGDIISRAFPFTTDPGGGIGFDIGIYYLTALLSILGPVEEVSGVVKTRNRHREEYSLDKFGTTFEIQSENLMAGWMQFANGAIGNILFDANSAFTPLESPRMIVYGTKGLMYMADPDRFGGEVKVILKGNFEPFVLQQSHAYRDECRGLGVAEMAWSMRLGRKHRANAEMAYHALEVLHGMVKSSQTRANIKIESSFEKPRALPRGFNGQNHFAFIEEMSIAK
jgi:predicted dehydrogenase